MPSKLSIRLACVKPAASVRSEPGSNSPIECLIVKIFCREHNVFTPLCLHYSKVHYENCYLLFKDHPDIRESVDSEESTPTKLLHLKESVKQLCLIFSIEPFIEAHGIYGVIKHMSIEVYYFSSLFFISVQKTEGQS